MKKLSLLLQGEDITDEECNFAKDLINLFGEDEEKNKAKVLKLLLKNL